MPRQGPECFHSLSAAAGRIELRICDDGAGFDTLRSTYAGQGLVNMRTRAQEFAGSFDIDSQPGRGYVPRRLYP